MLWMGGFTFYIIRREIFRTLLKVVRKKFGIGIRENQIFDNIAREIYTYILF